MTGHNTFEQLVAFADPVSGTTRPPITRSQYDEWKRQFSFDALAGLRYGQSFCNRFGITDNILYYTMHVPADCDRYIETRYLEK